MKKIFFILFITMTFLLSADAQTIVSEDVHFDYYQSAIDNDFENHFSSSHRATSAESGGRPTIAEADFAR